jgi:hypothetical protein
MSNNRSLASTYRNLAHEHLAKAQYLLKASDGDSHRYACLELRMCVEAITYGMLSLYRPELEQKSLRGWQPRKVFDELLNIDPHVETAPTVEIQDDAGEWHKLFKPEQRLTAKWAEKAHHALSNALHVPINLAGGDENGLPKDHHRARADKYRTELERVLGSESWHLFFSGETWGVECDCGALMKRRKDLVNSNTVFKCVECPRQYDTSKNGNGELTATLRRIIWKCNFCGIKNAFPEHQLSERYKASCRECGEHAEIRKEWLFFQRERHTSDTRDQEFSP